MTSPASTDPLASALQYLKGVGPRRAADLQRVGLATVEDLLYRFPTRYEDRGAFRTIASLRPGMVSSVLAEVISSSVRPTRRPSFKIFEMLVRDRTGALRAVFFNQPFLADVFHPHQRVILYGKLELTSHGLQLQNPQYEVIKTDGDEEEAQSDIDALHTGRIVPIYEKTGTLTAKMQRVLVHQALAQLPETLPDPLPEDVRRRQQLIDRRRALADVHFPPEGSNLDALNTFRSEAHRRLIFEEFFLFQLGIVLRKRRSDGERKSRPVVITDEIRESARRALPFKLTGDQKKALGEIVGDMQRPQPMNRLLQGDVGSGKTIVALVAALVAMENGLQVAFMAPTEILAEQHFINIRRLLEQSRFRLTMISGATPAKKRREFQAELAGGSMHMVIGTHALIEEAVGFRELGLVIIDEQHRFGVLQRAALRSKGLHPDVLVMTATPIPRTLALTAYGDLDTSIIREMPPGRHPIKTTARPEERRDQVYEFIRGQLDQGRQAYVIYPLVEESAKVDLKAATEMADHLAQEVFQAYRVGLLHGKMKQDAKDRVMGAFTRGELDVLVSTTVVEVGVDVANASVMLIEHAERFGLSQLHQLRGRVGRGPHQSYCMLLFQSPLSDEGRERLKALADTNDGFEIAERDLQLRGPGDFFGTRQSGLPTLRVGDLLRDHQLMEEARREAVAALDDPAQTAALAAFVNTSWEQRFGLVGSGEAYGNFQPPKTNFQSTPNAQPPMELPIQRTKRPLGGWQLGVPRRLEVGGWRLTGLRIIAGSLKGRRLLTPTWDGLRPTSDRLRETLFNVLAGRAGEARLLDGFAGTGAVGIEALSRGAAHVSFVESDPRAVRLIERNLQHCAVTDRYAIIRARFADAARRLLPGSFDLVFLDPPYGSDAVVSSLEVAAPLVAPGGLLILEHARRDAAPAQAASIAKTRDITSGDSALSMYQAGTPSA